MFEHDRRKLLAKLDGMLAVIRDVRDDFFFAQYQRTTEPIKAVLAVGQMALREIANWRKV